MQAGDDDDDEWLAQMLCTIFVRIYNNVDIYCTIFVRKCSNAVKVRWKN